MINCYLVCKCALLRHSVSMSMKTRQDKTKSSFKDNPAMALISRLRLYVWKTWPQRQSLINTWVLYSIINILVIFTYWKDAFQEKILKSCVIEHLKLNRQLKILQTWTDTSYLERYVMFGKILLVWKKCTKRVYPNILQLVNIKNEAIITAGGTPFQRIEP